MMATKTEPGADETVYVPLRGIVKACDLNKKPRTAKQLAADKRRRLDTLIRKAQRAMQVSPVGKVHVPTYTDNGDRSFWYAHCSCGWSHRSVATRKVHAVEFFRAHLRDASVTTPKE